MERLREILELIEIAGGMSMLVGAFVLPAFPLFLNPRFDPDWKTRRWTKLEAETLPLFPFLRASLYVPAVCSRFCARRLFGAVEGERYDFRGRAGTLLYVLCMVELVAGVGGGVVGVIARYTLKLLD